MNGIFRVTSNAQDVSRSLSDAARRQVPYALKESMNSVAKEIIKEEQKEMRRVFDRPTPFILNGLRVTKYATKQDLTVQIGFKDVFGRSGEAVENSLKPHIHGYPATRERKGMERWMRIRGLLANDEWLIPSRTFPLDRYGNVPGSLATKMLADIGAYQGASGFRATTRARKVQYVFGQVAARGGGTVKGIWKISGGARSPARGRWQLMMLVVRKQPTYRKRYDFYGIADTHYRRNLSRHFQAALERAIETAR